MTSIHKAKALQTYLGTYEDNSPLVIFRVFFGLLLSAESFGAIFTGWVHETFIEPQFTFTIIGFEWLQPLHGDGMIYYFVVMGLMGLLISLGLFYRAATFTFLGMWTVIYMMQKSHYNNHYYLLILLTAAMLILPAHKRFSLDAKWGFTFSSNSCVRMCRWFFILQLMIVYCFASLHKMNPDWILGKPLDLWFAYKTDYWLIGSLLAKEWMPLVIAWGGIIYDGTIVFLLLNKKTRAWGFGLSVFFNLFNSAVFQIGIFPYLMIALTIFFFPPDQIRAIFFRKKQRIYPVRHSLSKGWILFLIFYFALQLYLPLRNYRFEGKPSWTEEGHRLAWRMMLRRKSGHTKFEIVDKQTHVRQTVNLQEYLTPNQRSSMTGQPDMIWQFAQYLKMKFAQEGKEIQVYADAKVSLNGHIHRRLIEPDVDLVAVPWERWRHAKWIRTYHDD